MFYVHTNRTLMRAGVVGVGLLHVGIRNGQMDQDEK
jgi:hypothetical protein